MLVPYYLNEFENSDKVRPVQLVDYGWQVPTIKNGELHSFSLRRIKKHADKSTTKQQRYILAERGLHHAPYAPMHTHSECNIPTLQQEYKMYKRTKESTHVSELLGLLHLSLTFSAFSVTNKQHNDSGS